MGTETEVWKVITHVGREVFSGLEADARTYIANNFPRLHVEAFGGAPKPDAALVGPNADTDTGEGVEVFKGPESGFVSVADFKKEQDTAAKNGPNAPAMTWQEQAAAAGYTFDSNGHLIPPAPAQTWQEQAAAAGYTIPDNGGTPEFTGTPNATNEKSK